jgi:hypothetical protein
MAQIVGVARLRAAFPAGEIRAAARGGEETKLPVIKSMKYALDIPRIQAYIFLGRVRAKGIECQKE